jgi:fluoride exporter
MDTSRAPNLRLHQLPTDSDVDLHSERQRAELLRAPWATLTAISVGGAAGSLARYGFGVAFPAGRGGFPWATFAVNVTGAALIGVLMVLVIDVFETHPLVRPFLGVGVLGGFTTFSTYAVDIQRLVNARAAGTGLTYLAGTLVAALAAVYVGLTATRAVIRRLGFEIDDGDDAGSAPDGKPQRTTAEVRS